MGSYLYKAAEAKFRVVGLSNTTGTTVDKELDITDPKKWGDFLHELKPDIIVHTAALTWVDFSEENKKETDAINVKPVEVLSDYAKEAENNPHVIFISSAYVYEGKKGPYDEKSETKPVNYYGESKLKAEKLLKSYDNSLILRTDVVFGWHEGGKNFFMQMWQKLHEEHDIFVPDDQISNPTYVKTLVDAIMRSIEKGLVGTFIATGPETVDRYNFAMLISEHFRFSTGQIIPVKTSTLKQKAKRPMDCATNPHALQKALGMKFPHLEKNFEDIITIIPKGK